MADPRTLPLDRQTRPWRIVPDVARCGACLGALPPDTEAACSTCGTGTPRGLPRPPLPARVSPAAAPPPSAAAWWPNLPPEPSAPPIEAPTAGTRVTWVPQLADPEHPTTAELRGGVELTGFVRASSAAASPYLRPVAEVVQLPARRPRWLRWWPRG